MNVISGGSADEVYLAALRGLCINSSPYKFSRVDPVRDFGPVIFEIAPGCSRLITLKKRGFNPIFAFAEASWFLAGSNDLESLASILEGFRKFSDDGISLHGAYGYRMRRAAGRDQFEAAVEELRQYPSSRRAVIALWDPADLGFRSEDIPCNTHVYFKIRDGCLDMTVCNRSNDVWWGIPYNFFLFYSLQVVMAERLGLNEGFQRHFTDSLHLYERDYESAMEVVQSNSPDEVRGYSAVEREFFTSEDFTLLHQGEGSFGLLSDAIAERRAKGNWSAVTRDWLDTTGDQTVIRLSIERWIEARRPKK